MPQRLRCMACTLGMCDKLAHLLSRGRAIYLESDMHLIEIRRRIINIVLLSVAKGGTHIGGRIVDSYCIERREPRQLCKQSESDTDHQVLERGWPNVSAATRGGLV